MQTQQKKLAVETEAVKRQEKPPRRRRWLGTILAVLGGLGAVAALVEPVMQRPHWGAAAVVVFSGALVASRARRRSVKALAVVVLLVAVSGVIAIEVIIRSPPPKPPPPQPPKPFVNSRGMKFVWIQPGSFRMGGNKRDDEKPVHGVTITKGIYMSGLVTQAQWKEVMSDNPSHFKGDDLPVDSVSWSDCQRFCEKLQREGYRYRLPTEAEWEYACRAGTTTDYYSGDGEDALKKVGWYKGNSNEQTHPPGERQPNAWGLYDMHGPLWQWTQDWYGVYDMKDAVDPRGPLQGDYRVLRGGSWFDGPEFCRAATRHRIAPKGKAVIGFRVCFDLD